MITHLHEKNESQMSVHLKRSWGLKNTQIWLVKSIFSHVQACFPQINKLCLFMFMLMFIYMQKIKVIFQFIQEILMIREYTNLIGQECAKANLLQINRLCLFLLLLSTNIQKIRVTCQSIQGILMINEYSNLIGWGHFQACRGMTAPN